MASYSDCQITEDGVSFPVFFFTKTIAFGEMKSVQKVPFWKALLECMHPFKPPIYFNGGICSYYVLIETAKFRFAVYPTEGDRFVRLVSNRLTKSN